MSIVRLYGANALMLDGTIEAATWVLLHICYILWILRLIAVAMESHPHTPTVQTRICNEEVVFDIDIPFPDGVI